MFSTAIAFAACSGTNDYVEPSLELRSTYEPPTVEIIDGQMSLSHTETVVAACSEKFAYRVFKTIADDLSGTNLLISPASLWMGLSLAANGTAGNTYTQITDVMGCSGMDIDAVNDYNYKLVSSLTDIDRNVDIVFANAMLSKDWVSMHNSFISRMEEVYNAEMFNFDSSCRKTTDMINSWVRDHTHSKINGVVTEEEIRNINFAFINSMYFNASWKSKFYFNPVEKLTFQNADGSTSEADMLCGYDCFRHVIVDNVEFVEIPFGDEGSFNLTIALPSDNDRMSEKITDIILENDLSTVFDSGNSELIAVRMPAFRNESMYDMIDPLKRLGVIDLFDSMTADFSEMSDKPSFINLFKEKCSFEIDDKGANGASATVVGGICLIGGSSIKCPMVTIDRPFLYLVTEKSTNSVIFIGTVCNL